jgi:two-component system CheB/CheR fusion protein
VAERTHQVEALTASLTLAEQQERQRVSHILHDDLQQLLYSLLMRMHLVQRMAPADTAEQLCAIVAQLQQAVAVTRTLVTELNPPILATDGLPTALAWLADHMHQMYNLQVDLQVRSFCEPRNREIRTLLVQMVREVLFNVVKHSRTDAARLVVEVVPKGVQVHVEDDGVGFEGDRVLQTRGGRGAFGLRSIGDRLALMGGGMTIKSAPGQGSRVTRRVPCDGVTVPVGTGVRSKVCTKFLLSKIIP